MRKCVTPLRLWMGFTLVELLAVLAIMSIMVSLAAPRFQTFLAAVKIQTEVSRLMSDIVLARSEAIKRNRPVILCPASWSQELPARCDGSFDQGWLMFLDSDRDRILDTDDTVLKRGRGVARGLSLTNRAGTTNASEIIVYLPDGTSRRNRTLMICDKSSPEVSSWSVVVNIMGRPRLARDWGQCPGKTG